MSPGELVRDTRFRQVIQVVVAALAAYAVGLGVHTDHALFASLGAAMVVVGSVAEDLEASRNRVRGTLSGAAVGLLAVLALGSSMLALALAVFAVASLSIGLAWGPAAMRIGIAMTLLVLFTHSHDTAFFALWRALYTLAGVAIGLLVGRFLWPIPSRDELGSAVERVRTATAPTGESDPRTVVSVLTAQEPALEPEQGLLLTGVLADLGQLDRSLRALRAARTPESSG